LRIPIVRDETRFENYWVRQKLNFPKPQGVANIAGAIAGPGKLVKGAKGALAAGGLLGLGESKADLTKGEVGKAALDAGVGTVGGGVGYGLGKVVEPLLKPVAKKISGGLSKVSGKLAEKATGATGKQLDRFAPGAGEELLEKGIVRFGDSPKILRSELDLRWMKHLRI
jgi:hypothetical protein